LHLCQAGKFDGIRGIVLGDFPECEVSASNGVTVVDVFRRHFEKLNIPVVSGAPFGHTARAIMTLPLGVRGRLRAGNTWAGGTQIEILESACSTLS
jgi:muramoyltetrapeptide carboxypeptidase